MKTPSNLFDIYISLASWGKEIKTKNIPIGKMVKQVNQMKQVNKLKQMK